MTRAPLTPTLLKLRRTAASQLHGLADRLDRSQWRPLTRSVRAPLVRVGGAWWGQDELLGAQPAAHDGEQSA
jgi:hypothetical protein